MLCSRGRRVAAGRRRFAGPAIPAPSEESSCSETSSDALVIGDDLSSAPPAPTDVTFVNCNQQGCVEGDTVTVSTELAGFGPVVKNPSASPSTTGPARSGSPSRERADKRQAASPSTARLWLPMGVSAPASSRSRSTAADPSESTESPGGAISVRRLRAKANRREPSWWPRQARRRYTPCCRLGRRGSSSPAPRSRQRCGRPRPAPR
jgi:hypothetical protein